jgi:hypothetical protein
MKPGYPTPDKQAQKKQKVSLTFFSSHSSLQLNLLALETAYILTTNPILPNFRAQRTPLAFLPETEGVKAACRCRDAVLGYQCGYGS